MSKKKTSKLATASVVMPVAMWSTGFSLLKFCDTLINPIPSGWKSIVTDIGILMILLSILIGLGLGSAALAYNENDHKGSKNKRLAIEGIIISIVLGCITFLFALYIRQT